MPWAQTRVWPVDVRGDESLGVAALGLTMFTRWIPVHRAYVAAEAKVGRSAEFDFPAERAFPVSVVASHGVLAGTTFTLVLLAMLTG